jgi:hypothetical protein
MVRQDGHRLVPPLALHSGEDLADESLPVLGVEGRRGIAAPGELGIVVLGRGTRVVGPTIGPKHSRCLTDGLDRLCHLVEAPKVCHRVERPVFEGKRPHVRQHHRPVCIRRELAGRCVDADPADGSPEYLGEAPIAAADIEYPPVQLLSDRFVDVVRRRPRTPPPRIGVIVRRESTHRLSLPIADLNADRGPSARGRYVASALRHRWGLDSVTDRVGSRAIYCPLRPTDRPRTRAVSGCSGRPHRGAGRVRPISGRQGA